MDLLEQHFDVLQINLFLLSVTDLDVVFRFAQFNHYSFFFTSDDHD